MRIVYADGSALRCKKFGWACSAPKHYVTQKEGSGATTITTSSMTVEIKVITEALKWFCSTLEKIRGGNVYADWVTIIENSELIHLQWIFCPGHAGVVGNERTDKLAGSANNEGGLTLDSLNSPVRSTGSPCQLKKREVVHKIDCYWKRSEVW